VYIWGHAANGRLGIGETESLGASEKQRAIFPVPNCLRTLESITMISCGNDYTLARGSSGVWAWGCGSGGKLGLGDVHDRFEPILIPKLRGRAVVQIVASTWHSMALVQYPPLLQGGYIYSWGSGYLGQLGLGVKCITTEPLVVEYFLCIHTMVRMIAAGPNHSLAVTREGELYSWGSNSHGALGRKIDEKDVSFTPMPGHVAGFGALVNRIGRGFPRSISCGRDFSVVCTYPYEGPDFVMATRLTEEAKLREQVALITNQLRS
jgi:alpha-tubulin suppressor-like RCC1 family protein